MPILHQLGVAFVDTAIGAQLAVALSAGDTLVLFDRALSAAAPAWLRAHAVGVRVCIPALEPDAGLLTGSAIECIDDLQWLQLIVDHDCIQHWC
jgi:hypothetical protein